MMPSEQPAAGRVEGARGVSSMIVAARLVSFAIVCAALYWGQVVLVPLAFATFVAFVLSPAVDQLQRFGLPRIPAVLLTVALLAGSLAGLGLVVARQVQALAAQLPDYESNITEKIADINDLFRGGAVERVRKAIADIGESVERRSAASDKSDPEPVPVDTQEPLLRQIRAASPAFEGIASAGLSMLLAIVLLIKREDVRNRIVSLAGQTVLATTTKALEEAGRRISRYLLMQLVVNSTMGAAVCLGLYLIGVPYSALWGLATTVLRYIPYLGPWVAASLPLAVSWVTLPGWGDTLLVLGLFVTLELLSNNWMEPWLYGQSVGLSPIAVILAAIFWTWIWGAIGLVLATPLTVCLVVVGKHVSGLDGLDRLLGEAPPLAPQVWLYQRLIARDEDEAGRVLDEYAARHSLQQICDELLLPVMIAAKRDLVSARITVADGDFVVGALRDLIEDLPAEPSGNGVIRCGLVLGFPIQDQLDSLALDLLAVLMRSRGCEIEVLSVERLVGERIAGIEERMPAAVGAATVPPGDLGAARLVCKRLRARLPALPIAVGRFGGGATQERARQRLLDAGATQVADTLGELCDSLLAHARATSSIVRSA